MTTYIGFHQSDYEQSICDRFEFTANKFPERIAISNQGVQITYKTLNEKVNHLANILISQQVINLVPIVVMLDHDVSVLEAILGILKAGKAYVVLEPSLPKARFDIILNDLGEHLIITNKKYWEFAVTLSGKDSNIINIDNLDNNLCSKNLDLSISSKTLAAIFYTSGSTGKPKGVKRTHRGILHRTWLETNDYQICADDKIALLYSAGFAASVADIFNALLNGATLCLYDFRKLGIKYLTTWLQQEEITMFHLPVALFQQWLNTLNKHDQFPKLRQVTPSGKLYRREVERCWQHFSRTCTLVQRFGATETGMCTRFLLTYQTVLQTPVIAAGYPVTDTEILLLNEQGQPITDEGIGEIAIKSRYLSPGYWRKPELTSQKFLPVPNDPQSQIYLTGDLGQWQTEGCLEHLGRKDFMVKIRGFRVELGDIETTLNQHPHVQGAIVIARDYQPGEQQLAAYIKPNQATLKSSELFSFLTARLPSYMIPSVFVFLDTFPLTPNGKIDRQALPTPDSSERAVDSTFVAPRTQLEKRLSQIWRELLKLEKIGIHDNFFELGGHSLLAAQAAAAITQVLEKSCGVIDFFQYPTVQQLAAQLQSEKTERLHPSLFPIHVASSSSSPLFCVHVLGPNLSFYRPLAEYPEQHTLYGLASVLSDDPDAPHPRDIRNLAIYYIQVIKTIQPEGPYHLLGFSFGGHVAYEIAQQLMAQGDDIRLMGLLDAYCPVKSYSYLIQRIGRHYQNVKKQGWNYIRLLRLTSLLRRLLKVSQKPKRKLHLDTANAQARSYLKPQEHKEVNKDYRFIPYPGKITLFRAQDDPDAKLDWKDLAEDGLIIHDIPGDHLGMLSAPNVHVLATHLNKILSTDFTAS